MLPLAAGINKGGHYFRYIIPLFFFSCSYHHYSKPQKGLSWGFEFLYGLLSIINIRNSNQNKNLGTPPTPQNNPILTGKWGSFKKVTLQTCAPENFRSRRWGAERRVSRAQTRERGPPSALAEFLLPPLFKTTEGVVVGFQIFAWALKK